MNKKLLLLSLIMIVCFFCGCGGYADMNNYTDDKFKVGQIWSYQNRVNEDESTIIILKVEKYEKHGVVIHVAVDNLHIIDQEGKEHDYISHLPFSKEALNSSVTNLIKENEEVPDFQEGYDNWKIAFDNNKAGIWSVTVSEAVLYMEETLSKGK